MIDIFIISRNYNQKVRNLFTVVSGVKEPKVIVDNPSESGIFIPDELCEGYENLTGPRLPKYSAWEKLFFYFDKNGYNDSIIIEDDVAFDLKNFIKFFKFIQGSDLSAVDIAHKKNMLSHDWFAWELYNYGIAKSFNPLCFLSSRLIQKVLNFREERGAFVHHELLFATLAVENNFITRNLSKSKALANLFENFRWRPTIESKVGGFCHPVKTDAIHSLICKV